LPSARPRGSRRCSAQFRRSRWSLPPFWPVVGYGSRKVAPRAERARLAEYGVSDREGDRVTLRLRGELVGEETAEEFKESLDRHYVDDGVKLIRVELTDLQMISLEGVGVLLELYRESRARGKRFVAEGATGQVRDKLEVTGAIGPLEDPNR
jgi:anti-anti-sigma factor